MLYYSQLKKQCLNEKSMATCKMELFTIILSSDIPTRMLSINILQLFFLWVYIFKRFYLFIFRERGRERNIAVLEKHQSVASLMPPTADLAHNPGMCPNRELNWRPFSLQASDQSTEPHQPGLGVYFLKQDWAEQSRLLFPIFHLICLHLSARVCAERSIS